MNLFRTFDICQCRAEQFCVSYTRFICLSHSIRHTSAAGSRATIVLLVKRFDGIG